MGWHELADNLWRRNRRPLALAGAVITASALVTAAGGIYQHVEAEGLCCAEAPVSVPLSSPARAPKSDAALAMASSRSMVRGIVLPVGVAPERGLQIDTILLARAISVLFPEIRNIGGVRPDSLRWHPEGLALDVMIPNYGSAAGIALGDRIAAYAMANAGRFALNHVIWRRVLYMPGSPPQMLPDYGGPDANHFSHVHIATNGGGYPTGRETYMFAYSAPPVAPSGVAAGTFVSAH